MDLETVRVRVNEPQVTAKVMDGEAIIIDLSTGIYYSLGGVGGLIWSGIEAGHNGGGIVDTILARHEVSRETALSDFGTLVGELQAANLVVPADGDAEASQAPDGTASKSPYEPPSLQRYEDMAELFALDPPLPDTLTAR